LVIQFAPGTAARSAEENAGATAADGNPAAAAVERVAAVVLADHDRSGVADADVATRSVTAAMKRTNRASLMYSLLTGRCRFVASIYRSR
jgi:hypothetical protein